MQRKGKVVSLEEAASWVQNGETIGFGGNVLHRSPAAFARELARQKKRDLKLVKTAGAYEVDLLCAAEAVAEVAAGFIGYETEFGLCGAYRRGVQSGKVQAKEHACYTVITALRAAAYGVPFMPVRGLDGSDLQAASGFLKVQDPYTGEELVAVKSIVPDWAVLHVQEADLEGNAKILGQKFEDVLLSKAAKNVIVTTERIVDSMHFQMHPEHTDIPHFLVKAVVLAPGGALPGSCAGRYDLDRKALKEFQSIDSTEKLQAYLMQTKTKDHQPRWIG